MSSVLLLDALRSAVVAVRRGERVEGERVLRAVCLMEDGGRELSCEELFEVGRVENALDGGRMDLMDG